MFLPDTSIWIALTFDSHPGHLAASSALARATADQPAIFCRATQLSFLRLVSTPAVHHVYGAQGTTNDDALAIFEQLTALPNIVLRPEPDGLDSIWRQLARRSTASPKVWMDAYLSAFAIAASLTLITFDRDFHQFEPAGLKLQLL